jgi:hypothetical protein
MWLRKATWHPIREINIFVHKFVASLRNIVEVRGLSLLMDLLCFIVHSLICKAVRDLVGIPFNMRGDDHEVGAKEGSKVL